MTESAFFQDLAMLMAVAGLVAALLSRWRQPKVLGYIAAGVILSRYTWGGSFLADERSVLTIGQLGVVFLMFSMGLSFSLSDMRRIRSVAMPVAIVDTVMMTWLGYAVGRNVFGWGQVASLFLGAAICDSATTMLAKVADELKWSGRPFVKAALGSSVCEDIVCIGIVALITGVANGEGVSAAAVGKSLGGLGVFFLATLVLGFAFVPRLLVSVGRRGDDEALLLTLLGCCFFVSQIAYRFDFSLALGAFLVGVVGATSDVRNRLLPLVEPLRSMFAAVFFVTIGLLVDPSACLAHGLSILFLTLVVLVGKFLNVTLAALAAGERPKTAVQMGMGLAQIGEFAFMVAMIYAANMRADAAEMYQIVVAVSLLTTLLNPLMLRASGPVSDWVERHLPRRVSAALDSYASLLARVRVGSAGTREGRLARSCLVALAVIAVLQLAVAICCSALYGLNWSSHSVFLETHKGLVLCFACNVLLIALLAPVTKIAWMLGEVVARMAVTWRSRRGQLAFRRFVRLGMCLLVLALFTLEIVAINATVNLAPREPYVRFGMLVVLVVIGIAGWGAFLRIAHRAALRFRESVSVDERRESLGRLLTASAREGTVQRLEIAADSPAVGGNVVSLNIRANTGATVVSVVREGRLLRDVGPSLSFSAGDVLIVLGTDEQIKALAALLA